MFFPSIRLVESHNISLRGMPLGKRCLELGCGAGLCGVCLLGVGASHVALTDGDRQTLENCQHNVQASTGGHLEVCSGPYQAKIELKQRLE
jgi:predicted nicotinamide N-methyase